MYQSLKLKKRSMTFLKAHPRFNLIAGVGYRSGVIFNNLLKEVQNILDLEVDEILTCCEFIDFEKDFNIIAKKSFEEISNVNFEDNLLLNNTENVEVENCKCFLAVAGKLGLIKIIDVKDGSFYGVLRGHTGCINYMKRCGEFLISCSTDRSIRIWDLSNFSCAVVIGGLLCHQDQILCFDVNSDLTKLVSSSSDLQILQWEIGSALKEYKLTGKQILVGVPINRYTNIHKLYINKILYYGNLIVSMNKSWVSVIYNNNPDDEIYKNNEITIEKDSTIYIGCIHVMGACQNIEIVDHILIGLGENGDIYTADLIEIVNDRTPLIISTNIEGCHNFDIVNGDVYIAAGYEIYKIPFDLGRFSKIN